MFMRNTQKSSLICNNRHKQTITSKCYYHHLKANTTSSIISNTNNASYHEEHSRRSYSDSTTNTYKNYNNNLISLPKCSCNHLTTTRYSSSNAYSDAFHDSNHHQIIKRHDNDNVETNKIGTVVVKSSNRNQSSLFLNDAISISTTNSPISSAAVVDSYGDEDYDDSNFMHRDNDDHSYDSYSDDYFDTDDDDDHHHNGPSPSLQQGDKNPIRKKSPTNKTIISSININTQNNDSTTTTPPPPTKTKTKKRKKRLKEKIPSSSQSTNSSTTTTTTISSSYPYTPQTKPNAAKLFDQIAPLLHPHDIELLNNNIQKSIENIQYDLKLYKKVNKNRKNGKDLSSTVLKKRRVDYITVKAFMDSLTIDDGSKSKNSSAATSSSSSSSSKSKKKIKSKINQIVNLNSSSSSDIIDSIVIPLLTRFYTGNKSTTLPKTTVLDTNATSTSSSPTKNTTMTMDDVKIQKKYHHSVLLKAREHSIESPFLWSYKQKKKMGEEMFEMNQSKKNEKDEMDGDNSTDDPHDKQDKEMKGVFSCSLQEIRNLHNSKSIDVLSSEAEELVNILSKRLPKSSYESLITLFDDYNVAHGSHQQDDTTTNPKNNIPKSKTSSIKMLFPHLQKCTNEHIHLVALDIATFFYMDKQYGFHHDDPRILAARKNWNETRNSMIESLITSQNLYCELRRVMKEEEEYEKNHEGGNIEKEMEDMIAQPLIGKVDDVEPVKPRGRAPRNVKVTFECFDFTSLDNTKQGSLSISSEDSIKEDEVIRSSIPETEKMVFIDNLPIDISEEELIQVYSRCGDIQSVEIFNLRQDLDPGELSAAKQRELRKNHRLSGEKAGKKRQRDRTPVYAIITFKDVDGYNSATISMLRIFGMVVRRHPIRSIPANAVKSIYIQFIEDGIQAFEIEKKINELLHPGMHISPSVGHNDNAQTKCCEIIFPSFESTYHAFKILQQLQSDDKNCDVNWFQTPDNAMKYWKREMVIDP